MRKEKTMYEMFYFVVKAVNSTQLSYEGAERYRFTVVFSRILLRAVRQITTHKKYIQ